MNKLLAALVLTSSIAFAQGKAAAPVAPAAPDAGAAAAAPAQANTINLFIGETKKWNVARLSRATMANPQVADMKFRYQADDVEMLGQREGETTLSVWSGETRVDYRVVVTKK